MKPETIKKAGLELAEHLLSLSDEEFRAELDKAKTDDPELFELLTDILSEQAEAMSPDMMDEYAQMPDTLDRGTFQPELSHGAGGDIRFDAMNYTPPFLFSLEEIDKIYHDAKKSATEK
jgi:hypothetical protein